ncbi:hypothetical protein Pst134EA_000280 [Puccinia striiformis f. sp. tritici]|uniref:hypothetical protein n=1 Tax=Puccinia striiformis f. sp. tritici TaxID=168172 RepID=UPI0020082A63|nr:hypothetical protein Pst134EA_000280 [Puccinia striiformis f. sp. tritici]KAH9473205.1 hypothetical protein Pst134EA_000280 [Puccinia striiformis f. sp. tritici]
MTTTNLPSSPPKNHARQTRRKLKLLLPRSTIKSKKTAEQQTRRKVKLSLPRSTIKSKKTAEPLKMSRRTPDLVLETILWQNLCKYVTHCSRQWRTPSTPPTNPEQHSGINDMTTVPAAKCDKTSWPPGNKKAKDDCAQELKDTKWKDDLVKVNHDLAKHSQSQAAIFAEQKDMLVAMLDEATMLIDLDNIPEGGSANSLSGGNRK